MTPSRRVLLAAAVALPASALGFVLSEWIERRNVSTDDAAVSSRGIAGIGGAFGLTDHRGNRVDETTFRGKVRLLFFGFTHCPDVCPTALSLISDLLDRLGADAATIQPLFVTVDPERDTAEVLARYVDAFHPSIIGLTGTLAEIEGIAKAFRVYFKKVPSSSALGYTMDHTATIYVLDRGGAFRSTLDIHQAPDDALAVLRRVIFQAARS